jgi:phosphatidylglycerophosphate synthase
VFDPVAQRWLRPPLEAAAARLQRAGLTADVVSVVGFAIGVAAAAAIVWQAWLLGLALLLVSRLCDGLDGALARLTQPTDAGAFLDITLDFLFYAGIPVGFALADPAANALPAALLIASFVGTGSSFLAFAVLAERRGLPANAAYASKGLHYLGGLTEASETLVCFALMCLWPAQFALFALVFAALCALTTVTRIVGGWRALRALEPPEEVAR